MTLSKHHPVCGARSPYWYDNHYWQTVHFLLGRKSVAVHVVHCQTSNYSQIAVFSGHSSTLIAGHCVSCLLPVQVWQFQELYGDGKVTIECKGQEMCMPHGTTVYRGIATSPPKCGVPFHFFFSDRPWGSQLSGIVLTSHTLPQLDRLRGRNHRINAIVCSAQCCVQYVGEIVYLCLVAQKIVWPKVKKFH